MSISLCLAYSGIPNFIDLLYISNIQVLRVSIFSVFRQVKFLTFFDHKEIIYDLFTVHANKQKNVFKIPGLTYRRFTEVETCI